MFMSTDKPFLRLSKEKGGGHPMGRQQCCVAHSHTVGVSVESADLSQTVVFSLSSITHT